MASRYPPPRDRSPTRHFDRRPSATYTPSASSYRGTGDPQASSLDRAPPRGPKADFRGGYQFGSASRGRGAFGPRGADTWDRERERDRDARNQPPAYRRDEDRGEWPRRERDFPPSDRGTSYTRERSYAGRDRSTSPERPRRNSKETLPPFTRPAETASSYYGPAIRGGSVRGRGRGDWERSRGRSSFVSERDREFFPRSRSREDWRERDYDRGRPSGPDGERTERFERYDRLDDREIRGREHDVWPRDRSPGRNSTGRVSPGALSTVSQHGERYKADYDAVRKPALAGPLSARSEGRRETEPDYFSSRVETPRRDGPLSQPFSTPNVPPSASLGLDYGDPPSIAATTPSSQEKPAAPKPQLAKVEASTTSSSSSVPTAPPTAPVQAPPPAAPAALQPPSGPKADRVGAPQNAPSTPRAASQQFEPWPKSDATSRQLRPGPASGTPSSAHDPNWKSKDPTTETRTAAASSGVDRPLPANVPSGPRAASSNFRGRLLSNEQAAPNAPPTAPRQPKAITLENRSVPNAPIGPRSSTFPPPGAPHGTPPSGPQAGTNRQWVAPDYRPPKPSIMNQMNKPYQQDARERLSLSGPSARPGGVTYQSQQSKPKITQPMTGEVALQSSFSKPFGSLADLPSGVQTPMDEDMPDSPADIEMSLPASDDDDIEDDDGLDEDYFAASEETHRREMKLLESRKPPPSLFDPITATLVIRIQLLDMIACGIIPESYETVKTSVESAMDLDNVRTDGPLSPERTPEDSVRQGLEYPKPRGRPLSQPLINTIPTPPIDELPYLNGAMQDCHVFEETEPELQREANSMLLCQVFEYEEYETADKMDDLHAFYRSRYPVWRRDIEQAEQRLREVHRPSPAPASPAPSATPSLPAAPERSGGERTRGARNTTDLDMQQAILMSQQSAKEEEERREREAASNALPNYETEAVVPYMVKPSELDFSYFEDTNKKIDLEHALDVYSFLPPEDDFTEEEQAAFIAAYCQTPKKWGKIADSLPERSYQDCITHYYLTKDQANYKELWRRSQPKRGRRRAANVKPRASNLMSDLALNEDGEGTPVAVTDSGRPRRAAAPTFGDSTDPDAASTAPPVKRMKDSMKDTDPNQSKPRGRKGTGTGKGRRAKEKVLVDATGQVLFPAGIADASPQKADRSAVGKEKIGRSSLKTENAPPKLEPNNVAVMAAHMPLDVVKNGSGDGLPSNLASTTVQPPTSYWSVPEVQKFPELIKYFGKDYAAIAGFLKTKSPAMIKNYFMRELSNGKHELETLAKIADDKRARGEPMGAPPTPVQPPKRRYEATPASIAAIPRATVSTDDHHAAEIEPVIHPNKSLIEEFPSNSIQRIDGELVAKPRPPKEIQHVYPKTEEPARPSQPSIPPKTSQGPRRGIFQDDTAPYAQQHAKLQTAVQEVSPRQRPVQVVDHRSIETRPQQPQHIESRPLDFGRSLQPHREQMVQPQHASGSPQYPSAPDRSLGHPLRINHPRYPALTPGQNNHDQMVADLPTHRSVDYSRNATFNTPTTHSPVPPPVQIISSANLDASTIARPAVSRPEPPKPAPAKRSNVFSILNDDPPEPPAKKISLEATRPSSINTPPLLAQSMPGQTSTMHLSQQEDSHRTQPPSYIRSGLVDSVRIDPIRSEFRQEYSSSPAPGRPNEPSWLEQQDPRTQSRSNEQRPAQSSPAPGSYPTVPPSSQPASMANTAGRYDPARNLEANARHRSMLSMSAPSPPPQQQQQQQQNANQHSSHAQPPHHRRSPPSASQHGRGPSLNYQEPASSGASNYSHSTSSTPVSTLHQRSQTSIDIQPGQTIQQFMREREQAKFMQQQQHHQQQPSTAQLQHQQQQPPSQSSSRMPSRDIYGSVSDSRSAQHHHISPPVSQTSQLQQTNLGYPSASPMRNFTSPHQSYGPSTGVSSSHNHQSHHHQQQQQQQQQQSQSQSQPYQPHQSQYPHATTQAPSQHHQAYQGLSGYGPHQPQPLSQQRPHLLGNVPPPQSQHYHGYSAEERR